MYVYKCSVASENTKASLRLNERKFCAIPKFHKENIEAENTSVWCEVSGKSDKMCCLL